MAQRAERHFAADALRDDAGVIEMRRKHPTSHAVWNSGELFDASQQAWFTERVGFGLRPRDSVGLVTDLDDGNPQHVVTGCKPQQDFGLHVEGVWAEGLNDVMTHGMTSSFRMGSG